jgi:hypothetical protein
MTGAVNWTYVDQTQSAAEYATPTTIAASGGRDIGGTLAGVAAEIELHELDLRMEPGDVIAICLQTVSNTAVCAVGMNWQEK